LGDRWDNNSTLTTLTLINNSTQVDVSVVRETRQIVSKEVVRTPVGNLETYRISVESANALVENLWFSATLGQIVYAEYYNPLGEAVTVTMTSYILSGASTNLNSAYNSLSVPRTYTLVGNGPQVISTWDSAFPDELKISYE
jgi:hypothetical protein